jgi:carbon-monoxide dehydrogenase medium subunit
VRAYQTEAVLKGQPVSTDAINSAAERIGPELDPQSDVHATAAYRRHVAGVLTRRALQQAAARAKGAAA